MASRFTVTVRARSCTSLAHAFAQTPGRSDLPGVDLRRKSLSFIGGLLFASHSSARSATSAPQSGVGSPARRFERPRPSIISSNGGGAVLGDATMAYQHPYVKQVNRCATVAFAPNAPFIATGTMAGAIDLSFSTTACLEVRNSTVPRLAHLRFFPSVRTPRSRVIPPLARADHGRVRACRSSNWTTPTNPRTCPWRVARSRRTSVSTAWCGARTPRRRLRTVSSREASWTEA